MIGRTNNAKITNAITHGLQPDLACSSSPAFWIALVAIEGSVFPAGIEVSFEGALSSVLPAVVVRDAAFLAGAAVAAGAVGDTGRASLALPLEAGAFSDDFSPVGAAFLTASLVASSFGADFEGASDFV